MARACDDLAVLLDAGALGSVVVKFRLDAPWGLPTVAGIARADVPLPMRRLRLLDWDRDGRSDVAAEVPGLGVVIGRATMVPATWCSPPSCRARAARWST
ncbi:MAG: hypothetical protein IPK26_28520 [Planctomycetes bacterium]|nr:hypothetical protein [Planctomycetota bacterium]